MFHRSPSGFMLDFPNGWTASVQFGPGNYCTNQNENRNPFVYPAVQFIESNTAEIAAWPTESRGEGYAHLTEWYKFEDGQDVKGWQNVNSVMEFLNKVSAFPNVLTAKDVQEASKKWKPILNDWGIDY